jgi:purine-binding chemotaxis protein CheW
MSEIDIVTFRLDKRLFGLEARRVQDVFHPRGLTGVPLAASEIIGVLNLRGRIVTAVCARKRLGLADRPAGAPEPRAIGVELGGDSYGIVVDSVEGVVKLEAGDLLPPPDKLSPRWTQVVKGVFRLESELLVMLDEHGLLLAEAAAA